MEIKYTPKELPAGIPEKYWNPIGPITTWQSNYICSICRWLKPRFVLETGFCTGHSAISILASCSPKLFISIDKNLDYIEGGRKTAELYMNDFRNFEVWECDSNKITNKQIKSRLDSLDLAHIDGGHDYKTCLHDLELAMCCLSPRGIILVDDYYHKSAKEFRIEEVPMAVNDFCKKHTDFHLTDKATINGYGYAVLLRFPLL